MKQLKDISYTYIIRCQDNTLYTGITKDIPKRMAEHYYHKKQGAKYTKSRQAVEIMMIWKSDSWSAAATLEHYIKSLTRPKKLALIRSPNTLKGISETKLKGNFYEPVFTFNGLIERVIMAECADFPLSESVSRQVKGAQASAVSSR